MGEVNVRFPSLDNSVVLDGTFTFTTPASPIVVLIHGSGPLDRNENITGKLDLNTFNSIAKAFYDAGISCARYDKRGIGKSVNNDADLYYKAGIDELVDDAVACVKYATTFSNHLYIAGHSEGSLLLPIISYRLKQFGIHPIGLLFLCGFGQSFKELIGNQIEWAKDCIARESGFKATLCNIFLKKKLENALKDLDRLIYENKGDMLKYCFGLIKIPLKWLRDHLTQDLLAYYENVTSHCLVLGGDHDVQVSSQTVNFETAKRMLPNAKSLMTVRFPLLSHALRNCKSPSTLFSIISDYQEQGRDSVEPELLYNMIYWIKQTCA